MNEDLGRSAVGVHTCLPLRLLACLFPYPVSLDLDLWAQIQDPHGLLGLSTLLSG